MKRIAVIGAGASGMMAAIAASYGADVSIFDKNDYPGRKLLQTGNGKCNFLNSSPTIENYRGSLKDEGILEEILTKYDRDFILDLFSSFGLLYHEKNGGFYPRSDSAGSVNDILIEEMRIRKVEFHGGTQVKNIIKENNRFYLELYHMTTAKRSRDDEPFDAVIIATGGKAAPKTGSTGDAYYFAEKFGLKVAPPLPGLTRLLSDDAFFSDNSVRAYVSVKLYIDGLLSGTSKGELQGSTYGPSGICIFDLSGRAAAALKNGSKCELSVDFLPELSEEKVFELLKRRASLMDENGPGTSLFLGIFSERLSLNLYEKIKYDLNPDDDELSRISSMIKDMRFLITGTGDLNVSQITVGGIHAKGINRCLSAKDTPGLYFAGECLDADGDCGGYNLHFAWSSGYTAGYEAMRYVKDK